MDPKKLDLLRHSTAHVLAAAIYELFPDAKFGIGPAVENGFYYDLDLPRTLIPEDLANIEAKMSEIIKANHPFERQEISRAEAQKLFQKAGQIYKVELLKEMPDETVSIYRTGKFVDLCRGPHLDSTGEIRAFKLLKIAGAYWKGDEKNKMLQRVYGTAFADRKGLAQYLHQLEEAKKRDHRKLGKELDLFVFSDLVGKGLPLFTPKGALVRRLICEFVESLQSQQGIAQVWTPQFSRAELFQTSGHYAKYRENMFRVHSNYSEEEFYLKPMNCPQHTQIYASRQRSYKDLPIRLADFAMLYRDEKPGELSGLTRTRAFSQDDCHIFCTEDQVEAEMNKALDMTKTIMDTYGFSYKYRLSTKDPKSPEKYLGDAKTWDKAEKICAKVLKERKIEYFIGEGEAAFYAPKLDLIATDSLGREWQLSTLQVDFFLPERFDLTYKDAAGQDRRPVMLHRAISGSPERLMAILLEHYAGAWPVWLSPVQVKILPVAEKFNDSAEGLAEKLRQNQIRPEVDQQNESVGKKIRQAQLEKVPYMIVFGEKELTTGKLAIRERGQKELKTATATGLIEELKNKIAERR